MLPVMMLSLRSVPARGARATASVGAGVGGANCALTRSRIPHHVFNENRTYIHLPNSFQELRANLNQWWNNQEYEDSVVVRLRPKAPSASAFQQGLGSRIKRRIRKQKPRRRKLLRKDGMSVVGRRKAPLRQSHEKKRIVLREYSERSWFDSDGHPLTSRDSRTGRFVNPWSSEQTNGVHPVWDFVKWQWQRHIINEPLRATRRVLNPLKTQNPVETWNRLDKDSGKAYVTWIGHSTALIRLGGHTILTDPMFSWRAAPLQLTIPFNGVPRHIPPACKIEDLPPIDVCLVSHDHYDHLDKNSCVDLVDKVNLWVVPLGIKQWLVEKCGVSASQIMEMEWWERIVHRQDNKHDALTLTCAPTQHWSCRTMWDRNTRLWCSWALQCGGYNIYFGGDTGYPQEYPLFELIGQRLGPFDLSLLSIGAYKPSDFMQDSHTNPKEAVQIHTELRSKTSVAIHWGCFHLAEEDDDEPPRLLKEAVQESAENIDFRVLDLGESIEVPKLAHHDRKRHLG